MKPTEECPIQRFRDGRAVAESDTVVTEARIELDVNDGALCLAMLCLPQDLEALAVGFLIGEEALKRAEDLQTCVFSPAQRKVVVKGRFDKEVLRRIHLRWTRGTGCGGGGTGREMGGRDMAPLGPGPVLDPEALLRLFREFQAREGLWKRTGAVHACALSDGTDLLFRAEDVGRHNAFDKVIGMAALERRALSDKLVFTTGRLTMEIVSKAVACRVPVLVSRSAVTSLAVQLGRAAGLTLVGFLRGRRMNVYTGVHRLSAAG